MKLLPTKYTVGDKVYCTSEYFHEEYGVICGIISAIKYTEFGGNMYQFRNAYEWYDECELYDTEEEARSKFNTDLLKRYQERLKSLERDLEGHKSVVQIIKRHIEEVKDKIKQVKEWLDEQDKKELENAEETGKD